MPVYLVRWTELRVSLIRARDEEDLLQIIDEVASPRHCTWRVYRGPLWVDFDFPADFEIGQRDPAGLRREDVVPKLSAKSLIAPLTPTWGELSDTQQEMQTNLLHSGFPHMGAVLDSADIDERSGKFRVIPAQLKAALVSDVIEHDAAVRYRGAAFEKRDGELVLRRTELWPFLLQAKGTFAEIDFSKIEAFCLGRGAIRPGANGKVCIVVVEVALDASRPLSARIDHARCFSAQRNGMVEPAHRADIFGDSEDVEEDSMALKFLARRNAAVAWKLTPLQVKALTTSVQRKAGRSLSVEGK